MTRYAIRKIDLNKIKTVDDYNLELQNANIKYCDGLKEVENYCEGRVHRQRGGYTSVNGNFEYIIERA